MLRSCSVRCHTGRTCWKYPLQGNKEDIHSRCPTLGLDSKSPEGMLGSVGQGLTSSPLGSFRARHPGGARKRSNGPARTWQEGHNGTRKRKVQSCPSVPPAPSPNKIQHCASWGEMLSMLISIFSEQAMKDKFVIERQ